MKTRLLSCLALLILLAFAGCGKKEASPLASGQIVTNPSLVLPVVPTPGQAPAVFVGDGPYAVIKAEALAGYYENFRAQLFSEGVVKWDERFDCNHFASYYIAKAQTQYYLANFHSSTPAQTLALAEIWYRPGGGRQGHAIVAALTDQGLLFIEPQTGARLVLSPVERVSVFLAKW
jgi:hypothetical protein